MAASTDLEVRVVKRQKVTDQSLSTKQTSRIFAPFRTLGLVSSTSVPFVTTPLGKTTFQLTTSIGRSLQTYDVKRGLQLVFISSPQTPENITATVSWDKSILAAWGNGKHSGVWVFKRGKKAGELEQPRAASEPITQLLILGPWIVGATQSRIDIWKSSTLEHYTTLQSPNQGVNSAFSGPICNLPTYLNKIFAGKRDGSVEIWNVSTGKLVYTMLPESSDYGPVTALRPSPALSVLAVAFESGHVQLRNARTDTLLMSFRASEDSRAAVTSISFRTDGMGAGEDGQIPGAMATASANTGDVTFWDLNNNGRKVGVLRGAHAPPSLNGEIAGGISGMDYLPGQSVLVTSGGDNALKTWIFDDMPFSPIPRILHARGGHAAPVSLLQFLPTQSDGSDSTGKWLMSSSHDRSFWGWSVRRDNQSSELSQGNIRSKARKAGLLNTTLDLSGRGTTLEELKAPRITSMACSLNRDGGIGALAGSNTIWTNETKTKSKNDPAATNGWESVVTGHDGDRFARTWFWGRKRAGRWKFQTSDGAPVSSVAMSPCGTFALVGSAGGAIDMYNLQSGIHRQRFPARLTTAQAQRAKLETAIGSLNSEIPLEDRKFNRGEGKHLGAVTGIIVDNLNKTVVSCGADGKVKFWDFAKGLLLHELDWSLTSLTAIRFHRASDLVATSCDDGSIRVVDIETRKLVRELWGAKGAILDFIFSNDGRWIVSTSADSTVRVHDLATGHLIEALRFRSQPVALAFSPTGEYLATAHDDNVGIHLWANKTLFSHVPTRRVGPQDVIDIDEPTASGEGGTGAIDAAFDDENLEAPDTLDSLVPSTIDQLSSDLLTLSLVPKARWQTLLHLDTIRERNKPKEAPKKPQAAPFFLPSLLSSTSSAAPELPPETTAIEPVASSRISKIADPTAASTSTFTTLLLAVSNSTIVDPAPLFAHLSLLPPSAADVAIRTIDPSPPYEEPVAFLRCLTARLRQKRDYELVQTWIAVFLRCHASVVMESLDVKDALKEWKAESEKEGKRVGELVGYVRGVVGWVGGVV